MHTLSNAARAAYAWPKAGTYRGVSAIEYTLLLILIGVVTITVVALVGRNLPRLFNPIAAAAAEPIPRTALSNSRHRKSNQRPSRVQ